MYSVTTSSWWTGLHGGDLVTSLEREHGPVSKMGWSPEKFIPSTACDLLHDPGRDTSLLSSPTHSLPLSTETESSLEKGLCLAKWGLDRGWDL